MFVDNNAPAKKKVEEVMPIATGHEREELEAELEVLLIFISVASICLVDEKMRELEFVERL